MLEAIVRRYPLKQVFLKIQQISHESTCSNPTIKTPENCVKFVQSQQEDTRTTAKPATFSEPNCVQPSGFLVVIWCLYRRTFLMLAISSDKKPDNKLVYLSQSFSFQCSLLIPLKISENLCFFDVLRGVGGQKGILERKGLIY